MYVVKSRPQAQLQACAVYVLGQHLFALHLCHSNVIVVIWLMILIINGQACVLRQHQIVTGFDIRPVKGIQNAFQLRFRQAERQIAILIPSAITGFTG